MLLFQHIENTLRQERPLPVSWRCAECESTHKGNLVKKARSVRMEFLLDECRPDLTLFDADERPVAVIEVIVTHSPENRVREYYKTHSIALLEYHVTTEEDIERLRSFSELPMTSGSVCTRQKCSKCKEPLFEAILYVTSGRCWKCKASMKVAFGECQGMTLDPAEFSPEMITAARRKGVVLGKRYSNIMNERYLANCCRRCGNFVGQFYLHQYWCGNTEMTSDVVGLMCTNCERQ